MFVCGNAGMNCGRPLGGGVAMAGAGIARSGWWVGGWKAG